MRTAARAVLAAGLAAWAVPAAAQQQLDVKKYIVTMEIPDTGTAIAALVSIVFERRAPTADTLTLNLVGLTVDEVSQADMYTKDPASSAHRRPFSYDGKVLRIPLAKANPPGGIVFTGGFPEWVNIRYHGMPTDGLIIGTTARGDRAVFADNWPERARYWLPSVDEPRDKAEVWFTLKAPLGWRVVANGRLSPESRNQVWLWSERRPVPTYTMVLGAAKFSVSVHRPVIRGRDTIPVMVWTYPQDSAYADSVPFRRATEIVEVMERLIGPYPYESLKHVQSATRFGGMENASAIFYAETPYVERRMGEGVVRHETAHQWFGDAVTPRDWPHLWLSEGFATYFDAVVGAALDGDSVLKGLMRANAESYFSSDVTDRPIVDSAHAAEPMTLLNANSYPKAAWVLHMLRGIIGDSAFFKGLRTYYRTYRDSTATSEDFQAVVEAAAGTDLGWFFGQWLHQPGYPQLDVTWQYDAGAGRVLVGITQRQKPEWGLFRLPVVTIEFRGEGGVVLRRDVAVTGRETFARFDVPFPPTETLVDPDGKLLVKVMSIGRR